MAKLPRLDLLPLLKENEIKLYMNISIKRRYFKIRMHLQKLFEAIALSCTVLVSLAKACWNLTNVRLTHPISFGMTYDVVTYTWKKYPDHLTKCIETAGCNSILRHFTLDLYDVFCFFDYFLHFSSFSLKSLCP